MREIILEKISELENAKHPNNKEVGYIRIGKMYQEPEIGQPFYCGINFRTSNVTEIIDGNTFKTLNSVYRIKVIESEQNQKLLK